MVPSFLLLSSELSVSVKENPDRKKKSSKLTVDRHEPVFYKTLSFAHTYNCIFSSAPEKGLQRRSRQLQRIAIMKFAITEDGKSLTQYTIPGSFQTAEEENGFRASVPLSSILIVKKRRFGFSKRRTMLSLVYRESILLHSTTVEIDDKNNCRTSGSKYIPNTSEQDLNSSYRETQDSKTEDTPSTNESPDEQNLSPNF